MARPRDAIVSEHARRDKKKHNLYYCNYCVQVCKGSTRMKNHLAGQPGRGISACEKVPPQVRQKVGEITKSGETQKRRRLEETTSAEKAENEKTPTKVASDHMITPASSSAVDLNNFVWLFSAISSWLSSANASSSAVDLSNFVVWLFSAISSWLSSANASSSWQSHQHHPHGFPQQTQELGNHLAPNPTPPLPLMGVPNNANPTQPVDNDFSVLGMGGQNGVDNILSSIASHLEVDGDLDSWLPSDGMIELAPQVGLKNGSLPENHGSLDHTIADVASGNTVTTTPLQMVEFNLPNPTPSTDTNLGMGMGVGVGGQNGYDNQNLSSIPTHPGVDQDPSLMLNLPSRDGIIVPAPDPAVTENHGSLDHTMADGSSGNTVTTTPLQTVDGNLPNPRCRLFGVELPSSTKEKAAETIMEETRPNSQSLADSDHSDLSKSSEEKQGHSKHGCTASRSRIKVQMQGVAVGRTVDLLALEGYDEFIDELEKMFDIMGELQSRDKWEIVFTDDEGDLMLARDDPWLEFCKMAKRIFICSSQDVKKMSPGSKLLPASSMEGEGIVLSMDSKN